MHALLELAIWLQAGAGEDRAVAIAAGSQADKKNGLPSPMASGREQRRRRERKRKRKAQSADDGCCSRERARGNKAVAFHNPQALSNVEEENLSCARDQVVAARPPVLTPPMALSALSCE